MTESKQQPSQYVTFLLRVKKMVLTGVGLALVLIGVVFGPLPFVPGLLIIFGGLTILSTQHPRVQVWLERAERLFGAKVSRLIKKNRAPD